MSAPDFHGSDCYVDRRGAMQPDDYIVHANHDASYTQDGVVFHTRRSGLERRIAKPEKPTPRIRWLYLKHQELGQKGSTTTLVPWVGDERDPLFAVSDHLHELARIRQGAAK